MEELAIMTEGLARSFGAAWAVAGVDLAIARGEIYGFLGPNGAGKSTLVRMLCTLLRPTRGRGLVAGYDISHQPELVRLRIGVALQEAALDDRQSGRELLDLQARLYGLRRAERRARLAQVIDMVDIGAAIDMPIGTYSGGMRRRLDLGAALVHDPEIVFLDEPTTGLDPASRSTVWNEVRALNSELGTTIFLTTQYLEEADELAGRIGIISSGRIVAEGPPADLKRSVGKDVIVARITSPGTGTSPGIGAPARMESVLTALRAIPGVEAADATPGQADEIIVKADDGAGIMSPIALVLHECEARVTSLTLRTPTLDDVFLHLTGTHLQRKDDV
ncbi:MAG: ATP-binding cassette domain-containing protein [Acidimicrobiales bacterium]